MRLIKPHEFSNPYSRSNKKLIRRTSRDSRDHSPQRSNSKSKQKFSYNASISEIPQIQDYAQKKKLILGKERIQKIKYSLQIEEISRKNFQLRMRGADQYIKYQQQAIDIKKPSDIQVNPKTFKTKNKHTSAITNKQIYEALHHLRGKDILEQIKRRVDQTEYRVRQTLNTINAKNQRNRKNAEKLTQNHQPIGQTNSIEQIDSQPFDELDNILSIKEQSFFHKKVQQKQLNIFKYMLNPKDKSFQSGYEILNDNHFTFDSIYNNANKRANEQINIAMSTYARMSIKHNSVYQISPDFRIKDIQVLIDSNYITFNDIILIAKGLIQPNMLFKSPQIFDMGSFETEDFVLSQITNQHSLIKKGNEKRTNVYGRGVDKSQLQYYRKVPLKHIEKEEYQIREKYTNQMKEVMKIKNKCGNKSIYDRKIHKNFDNQIDKLLSAQANAKVIKSPFQMERLIRLQKMKKDKRENIRIQSVINSIKYLKHQRSKIKSELNSKSRSKSKSPSALNKFSNLSKQR